MKRKKTFAEMEEERDAEEQIAKELPEEEEADDLDTPPRRITARRMTFAEREEYEDQKARERGRWICNFCGAKHQYHPPKCARCDHSALTWWPEGKPEPYWCIEEGSLGWRAKRLFRLAEQYYYIPFATLIEDLEKLKEAGLDDCALPESVIRQAKFHMMELSEKIRERIDKINNWNKPKPEPRKQSNDSVPLRLPKGDGKRSNIYGFPVTAVIRWMGANEWTYKEALKCLTVLNIPIAESTIRIQLNAGKTGARGEPAALTDSQGNELRQSAGKQ